MSEPVFWNASLSTMWAMKNFTALGDFYAAARRMGFATIELNHQIDSVMLDGIDFSGGKISSIHEPCPADIPVTQLKTNDWLLSSPQEQNRRAGVKAVQRSIDLADALGVRLIVVHAGNTGANSELEKQLRTLFRAGKADTPEYRQLKAQIVEQRAARIGPHFAAVQQSLVELVAYAQLSGIRLGLENRYHYMDIPAMDEMEALLAQANPEWLGFWYDTGHAQALDQLGFFPYQEWLQRFGPRILGTHLHDVQGIDDHDAPGSGVFRFAQIASYLPSAAVRTLEVKPSLSPAQVEQSLLFLAHQGLVQRL